MKIHEVRCNLKNHVFFVYAASCVLGCKTVNTPLAFPSTQ